MMMRRLGPTAFALLCAAPVLADPPPATAPPYRPSSGALIPVAIYDAAGNVVNTFGGGSGGGGTVAGSQEQDVRASQPLSAATANAALTYVINGQATVGFTFTGLTASGATLTYEQSIDGGTTWTAINAINRGTGVPEATRATDGQIALSATGRTNIRVRVSTAGTGTITVASNISVREGIMSLGSPLPPGANAIGSITNAFALEATQQQVASLNATIAGATGAQADTTYAGSGAGSLVALSKGQYAILSALSAAYGAQGDAAATASGSSGSMIALTRAIRDRLAGTLTVGGTVAATQSGAWTVGLSAGAAVLADLRVAGASVASGNPVPVTGTVTVANPGQTGSVTAAGTSGTQAQAVQGVTGGVPLAIQGGNATAVKTDGSATTQPISAATMPLPANAATSANQASEIAALGAPADTAYAGSGTASTIAALKGLYAATLARQVSYVEATGVSLAANAASTQTSRAAGSGYTKFNATAGADAAGAIIIVRGSNDGFATFIAVAQASIPTSSRNSGNAGVTISAPVNFSAYQAYIVNGSTANTVSLVTSYTAN